MRPNGSMIDDRQITGNDLYLKLKSAVKVFLNINLY